jgi:hypothetical protein
MLAVPGVEWNHGKGLLQGWGQTRRRGQESLVCRALWAGDLSASAASGRGRVPGLSGLVWACPGLKSKSQQAIRTCPRRPETTGVSRAGRALDSQRPSGCGSINTALGARSRRRRPHELRLRRRASTRAAVARDAVAFDTGKRAATCK